MQRYKAANAAASLRWLDSDSDSTNQFNGPGQCHDEDIGPPVAVTFFPQYVLPAECEAKLILFLGADDVVRMRGLCRSSRAAY